MLSSLLSTSEFAVVAVRILAGVVFFFQGYDKLFKIGIRGVAQTIGPAYRKAGLPDFLILSMAAFTTITECAGGFLLIVGFMHHYALYLLMIDLLLVSVGMSLLDPVWDMKLVFPRLIMLVFLLFQFEKSLLLSVSSIF